MGAGKRFARSALAAAVAGWCGAGFCGSEPARDAAAESPTSPLPPPDAGFQTRFVAEAQAVRGDSPFGPGLPLTDLGRDRARLEQEMRARLGPVSLLLTATATGLEGSRPDSKATANELYVDFGRDEDRYTVGKKILSGDVGYGFRPLDVLQREARRQVLPPTLEGIPHLAWERYTADAAWSVVYGNPGHGQRGEAREDESLALRAYRRLGGTDLHAVARRSARFGLEAGAALAAVPDESLELHASFLAQRRSERPDPAGGAPLALHAPRKALAGLTWTTESGWSLLGEAWWDGAAPTAQDWRTLAAQARTLNALSSLPGVPPAAVAGGLAAATRLFALPNLARKNVLTRLAWTDPAGGGWSASLELLHTPEDGGRVATAAASWGADRLRLEFGLRRYGGRPESAYRLLPTRQLPFLGLSLAY